MRKTVVSALVCLVLIALGVGVLKLATVFRPKPEKVEIVPPRLAVRTQVAKLQNFQEKITGYGFAKAMRQTVIKAQINAQVQLVSAKLEAGSAVRTQEELLRLEKEELQQQLNMAKADLQQAYAQVEMLQIDLAGLKRELQLALEEYQTEERELTRIKKLEQQQDVSLSALDQQILKISGREKNLVQLRWRLKKKNPELERAQALVAMKEATLDQAEHNLTKARILAPYNGVILKRFVDLGGHVTVGEPLVEIVDPSRVEIAVSLGASYFGEVTAGSAVSLYSQGQEQAIWQGKITRVAPRLNQQERTFVVYIEVNDQSIPPGAFVIAKIHGKNHRNVIPLPRTALLENKIYLAKNKQNSEAIVEERKLSDLKFFSDIVIASSGLAPGEEVIISGIEEIANGSKVNILEEETREETPNN